MVRLLVLLLVFSPFCGTKRRGEAPPKITKRAWADFKPGSFARYRMNQRNGGAPATEYDYKLTLVEPGADSCSMEYEITMNGTTTRQKYDMPNGQGIVPAGTELKSGNETLTVNGRRLRCVLKETELDQGGVKYEYKTWMCNDVPGLVVKMEMHYPNGEYTYELVEWESKK